MAGKLLGGARRAERDRPRAWTSRVWTERTLRHHCLHPVPGHRIIAAMGNDGGSIPTRRELVKEAARNPTTAQVKEARAEQAGYGWSTDPISREPLVAPVVSDSAGKLYNKATIIEYLVEGARKDDAETQLRGSVKSLKDVVEVRFESDSENSGKWKCPITGETLGPGSKAAYLVPCGHAFSGAAIKEVSGEKCLTCDTEYASNDIIPIVPVTETDIVRLHLRVKTLAEKGLSHSLKKVGGRQKRKKGIEEAEQKKPDVAAEVSGTGINNASTASIAAKVREEQEKSKKRKTESKNVQSLFSSRDQSKPMGKSSDFMSRGYSLPTATKQ